MATESTPVTPAPQRPRVWLLVLLGLTVAGVVAYSLWRAGNTSTSTASPSNDQGARAQATAGTAAKPDDVRLDALKTPPPEPGGTERNPFRFQPKAPASPPSSPGGVNGAGRSNVGQPPGPPPPPQIPPIPLKFIGTLEGRGPGKVAIFSDPRGTPVYGHEGDIILGQYRIVRIGVESVVMEYADGRGRQMIPLTGR